MVKLRVALLAALVVLAGLTVVPAASAAGKTWWAQNWYAPSRSYRPHTLQLTGDGTLYVARMTWRSWTADVARGHGRAAVNDCKPNCAAGTYHHYPVRVRLDEPRHVCGHRFFTRVVMTYTAGHPRGQSSRWVARFGVRCF